MKIQGAKVLGPDFRFHPLTVEVQGDTIAALNEITSQDDSCDVVLSEGQRLIPGLIDTHMHGYYGRECSSGNPEDLLAIGRHLAMEGVTGYAATISASPDNQAESAIRACGLAAQQENGFHLLGIHMEGPFLNPVKKGAMRAEYLQKPSVERIRAYQEAAEGRIRLMTLAPELEGAEEAVRYADGCGIRTSIGHTNATGPETRQAIDWGMHRATHTFNAMRPLHHRNSGVLETVLTDDRVRCEMIADFVHLNPEICRMIYRLKGAERITLISDSCALAGLRQEDLPAGAPYIIREAAYLADGTLCGSIGTVMTCVRNLVSIGIPMEEAVRMASLNPAQDLGVDQETGSIAAGKRADFVIVDESLHIVAVYGKGRRIV